MKTDRIQKETQEKFNLAGFIANMFGGMKDDIIVVNLRSKMIA